MEKKKNVQSKWRTSFTIDRILIGLNLTVSRPVDRFCDVSTLSDCERSNPTDSGIDGNKIIPNIVLRLVLSKPSVVRK